MDAPTPSVGEFKLAVLIDADNVSSNHLQPMMQEIARYGNPTIKRIYGDWTRPNLSGWKALLLDYAISPVQQFSYTVGKNATDSAMIIDAMDILYEGKIDGYCLVSSDSDFTRLAMRLREAGKLVIGIGEQKTPNAFISACDRFIFQEVIHRQKGPAKTKDSDRDKKTTERERTPASGQTAKTTRTTTKADDALVKQDEPERPFIRAVDDDLIDLITSSIEDVQGDDDWAFLAEVGNLMMKKQPSFDARNYGFTRLTPLIQSIGAFEVDVRDTGYGQIKHIYVRVKDDPKNKLRHTRTF